MKNIFISLFCMFIPMTSLSYTITNDESSIIPIKVVTTKIGDRPNVFTTKSQYLLKPGKSGSWNQGEIQKKLKIDSLQV